MASVYQTLGYAVRELQDVETAGRWLLEPGDAHRLAVVDDPLGTIGTSGGADDLDALDSWRMASHRIGGWSWRKASPVLAAARVSRLSDVAANVGHWRDMGKSLNAIFLGDVWRVASERFDVARSSGGG